VNHLVNANKKVGDTPMTDAVNLYIRTRRDFTITDHQVWQEHGEHLERELNRLNERITQLEQENDSMRADLLLWNDKDVKP
jgi:hypothetical protein